MNNVTNRNVMSHVLSLPPEKRAMFVQLLKQKTGQQKAELSGIPSKEDAWVMRYRPNEQARLRLFCFPYAGGSASLFRSWQEAVPADVEVCAIQPPGREQRLAETPYTRIKPFIHDLAVAIMPYLDRPFAFYGHSMGSLVSFELARYLRREYGKLPVCLYLAAYRAPQLPNPNIKIYHLPTEVFKVVLRADGIAETLLQNEELMNAMLPTLRADFELCDTYHYEEESPLDCPFVIFGGMEDVRVRPADLEQWPMHSSAGCRLSLLPGSHFFLHSARDMLLAEIAQDLHARLDALAGIELVHAQ